MNIIAFDPVRSQSKLINYCEKCKNYEELIMSFTFLKNISEPLANGFYRTDMVFGSGNRKNPLVVVGIETYKKLKVERLKGLYFEPINA
jgi:hypothetical protein